VPPPEIEIEAIRTTAGISRLAHVRALRFSGAGAYELLDVLTARRLFVREDEMIQSVMLDTSARVLADVFVCQDEDSLILLAEGPTAEELRAHAERVRAERLPSAEVQIDDLTQDHALFGIDGPFSWEVTTALLGPEVLGAPYLSFLRVKGVTCFRAGKTGEFGFMLLVPSAGAGALWEKLLALGAAQGMREVSLEALDQCALENWHYSVRLVGQAGRALTPLELQLQWRVDYDKDFVGAEALRARRSGGLKERVTCFISPSEVRAGQRIDLGGDPVGTVLAAGWSSVRKQWVGWALTDVSVAWPGIRDLAVEGGAGKVPIETRSPPLLNNRSLHVDPHRHSHQTRAADQFPPLVFR
jgi:glycine cleavage system aminomethyltransferase T